MAETVERQEDEAQQTWVLLGNDAPMMQTPIYDPELGHRTGSKGELALHLGQTETRVAMWPGFDDEELVEHTLSTDNDRVLALIARSLDKDLKRYAVGLAELEQIWSVHSANFKPIWVTSNDENFARAIAGHFGCDIGQPQALLTNGGRDALHAQHLSTGAQPAAFTYIALANSATATSPSASDTTLAGEITTVSGGLVRSQATYAHSAGTNTTTLTKTFTANGSDSLPVTISMIGIFNASSGGTMAYKTSLSANATLSTSGDNVTCTETISAG